MTDWGGGLKTPQYTSKYDLVHPNKKLLELRIKQGYKFIAHGTDGVFLNQSAQL